LLWIRIREDPKLLPDPELEVSDPDPGQDLKLDVNMIKIHKKWINFVIFYHYKMLNLSIL
jgi:hypothetical protein